MTRWVLDDPARFLLEKAELEKLAAEGWLGCAWLITRNGRVQVDLDIKVHDRVFAGRLTYPDHFPNSPPYIHPRDRSELWSGHQYGPGGSLCLEWRADNWHPQVTGAEVVRSAYRLLSSEQHPQAPVVVPSAHRVTLGQELRHQKLRFVSTPGLIEALAAFPDGSSGKVKVVSVAHNDLTVRFVSQVSTSDTEKPIDDLPNGLTEYFPLFTWTSAGWVFRSSLFETIEPASADQLVSLIESAGLDASPVAESIQNSSYLAPLVLLVANDPNAMRVYSLETGSPRELRRNVVLSGSTSDKRIPEEPSKLGELRVGIVGLGSIGSKIAVSLARSGVRKFVLVDDDVLLPENMTRHELSWSAAGTHKVDGTRDALRLIAPKMEIVPHAHRLAGQESPANAAAKLSELSRCDLIVDATANPEVFLLLAAVAQSAKKPMVWAEVFAGGYGGLIARARPSRDPNPLAVRDALHAHFATLPVAPFKNATGYDVAGDSPHRAYDSDVSYVAAAAAQLAIDTVLSRDPSEFPHPVYLLGVRKGWIFEQPFDTRPVDVTGPGWEIDQGEVTPEVMQQALLSAAAMLERDDDANG